MRGIFAISSCENATDVLKKDRASEDSILFGLRSLIGSGLVALLILVFGPDLLGADQSSPLTTLGQVEALSLDDGGRGVPVRIRATVTYNDPDRSQLFVQDNTGSASVRFASLGAKPEYDPQKGQIVELEGVTVKGRLRCNLLASSLRVVGEGTDRKSVV